MAPGFRRTGTQRHGCELHNVPCHLLDGGVRTQLAEHYVTDVEKYFEADARAHHQPMVLIAPPLRVLSKGASPLAQIGDMHALISARHVSHSTSEQRLAGASTLRTNSVYSAVAACMSIPADDSGEGT